MAQGPNEARFKNSLLGASWESVDDGAAEWKRCADLLGQVARSLDVAAGKDKKIGGRTGPAMGAAFRRTSGNVVERAQLLLEGRAALDSAARVIEKAEKARKAMDAQHPASDNPGSWKRPVGPLTEEDLKAQQRHQQKVNDFQENYAARERISQQWSDNIDNIFADSTEVMKKIHGEPDPIIEKKKETGGPGSVTPGTPQGPRNIPDDPTDTDPTDPRDPDDTGDNDDHGGDDHGGDDHGGDDHGGDDHGGDDQTDVPPTHSDNGGGIGTGTLGGLAAAGAGGAVAFGGFRGGLQLPSALSSTGVRPIGSTGRIGTSGALGRGGAIAPGSPVTRTGASGAAGRGAAGRGIAGTGSPVGRGGRGTAGAKGAGRGGRAGVGGIGTGRGAGKKDEEKKQTPRDLFDDGEDWIDDEGAAPNVLG